MPNSATCSVDLNPTPCTLGQVFLSQILSISSANVGVRNNGSALSLVVNPIRNSPYNSSFVSIF